MNIKDLQLNTTDLLRSLFLFNPKSNQCKDFLVIKIILTNFNA